MNARRRSRQEALFNHRQQGRVIAYRVRYICRLGEWRNRDQWDADSKLIESGATCGEWPSGIAGQRRAQRFGVDECGICCADEIPGTFGPASRLLTEWGKRKVFALSRKDAIWSTSAILPC